MHFLNLEVILNHTVLIPGGLCCKHGFNEQTEYGGEMSGSKISPSISKFPLLAVRLSEKRLMDYQNWCTECYKTKRWSIINRIRPNINSYKNKSLCVYCDLYNINTIAFSTDFLHNGKSIPRAYATSTLYGGGKSEHNHVETTGVAKRTSQSTQSDIAEKGNGQTDRQILMDRKITAESREIFPPAAKLSRRSIIGHRNTLQKHHTLVGQNVNVINQGFCRRATTIGPSDRRLEIVMMHARWFSRGIYVHEYLWYSIYERMLNWISFFECFMCFCSMLYENSVHLMEYGASQK